MTLSGWIFMLVSCGVIIGLFAYAMYRTLTAGKNETTEDID